MISWVLFIVVYNVEAVSTQQMFFQDQSSCERVGKRIVQTNKRTTYVCTQARVSTNVH